MIGYVWKRGTHRLGWIKLDLAHESICAFHKARPYQRTGVSVDDTHAKFEIN